MPSGNFRAAEPPPRQMASTGSGLNPSPFGSGVNERPRMPTNPNIGRPASGPQPVMPAPAPGPRVAPDANKLPSRERRSGVILWFVFLILLFAAVGIGLQTFGVFDVYGEVQKLLGLPKEEPVVDLPKPEVEQPKEEPDSKIDPEKLAQQNEEEVAAILKDAKRDIDNTKLPAALEKLDTASKILPDKPEIYEMKAEAHTKLGQEDKAAEMTKKAEELRAAAQPEAASGDAGAGAETDAGEPEPK